MLIYLVLVNIRCMDNALDGENQLAKAFSPKEKKNGFFDFCNFGQIGIYFILIVDVFHFLTEECVHVTVNYFL